MSCIVSCINVVCTLSFGKSTRKQCVRKLSSMQHDIPLTSADSNLCPGNAGGLLHTAWCARGPLLRNFKDPFTKFSQLLEGDPYLQFGGNAVTLQVSQLLTAYQHATSARVALPLVGSSNSIGSSSSIHSSNSRQQQTAPAALSLGQVSTDQAVTFTTTSTSTTTSSSTTSSSTTSSSSTSSSSSTQQQHEGAGGSVAGGTNGISSRHIRFISRFQTAAAAVAPTPAAAAATVDWAWPNRHSSRQLYLKHILASYLLTIWKEGDQEAKTEAGNAGASRHKHAALAICLQQHICKAQDRCTTGNTSPKRITARF